MDREPFRATDRALGAQMKPRTPAAVIASLQHGVGNAAVASLALGRLATQRIQRFPIEHELRVGKISVPARRLVKILQEESDAYLAGVRAAPGQNPFLADFLAAKDAGYGDTSARPSRDVRVGSTTTLTISPGMYTNLQSKEEANRLFGEGDKVRGGGPSYPEFLTALEKYRATNKLTNADVAGQMLAVLRGKIDETVVDPTHRKLVALPIAVIAGAETTRNSKAYGSVLMFLELVAAGRFTLADGLGVGNEVRDARESWGLLPTLSFFGLSPGRHKTESTTVLEAFVNNLDLDEASKDQIRKQKVNPALWGGVIPMTGGKTAVLGGAAVPEPASGPMNLVQAKEGSLAVVWLKQKIAEKPGKFAEDPEGTVRQFFRELLRSQDQQAPTVSVAPTTSTVPAGRVTNGLRPGEIEGLRQRSYTESFQSEFESLVVLLVERNTATGLTERDASAYLASVFRG